MKTLKILLMNKDRPFFLPVYNDPSFVVCWIVCSLVELFLHTLKRLNSSLLNKAETISGENNSIFICIQRKISGKIQNTQTLSPTKSATKACNIEDIYLRDILN